MGTRQFNIPIPLGEDGLVGRQCPSCKMYFKLEPGTGLPTTQCICPYCSHTDGIGKFLTDDQRDNVLSIGKKQILEPLLHDVARSLKRMETTSNSFLQIKVSTNIPNFPIQYYQEKILETSVTCDTCGLVFSIYGVFSNCPDCGKLNARVIYDKSLDASNGKLVLSGEESIDEHIRADLIKDALTASVSAFDSLGKALRAKYTVIPAKPKNLFQNFQELDKVLARLTGKSISQFLTVADSDFLFLMFQVRHIYEHNAGVIDSDFVAKLPAYSRQLERKYPLKKDDVSSFIALMRKLGDAIYSEFEK